MIKGIIPYKNFDNLEQIPALNTNLYEFKVGDEKIISFFDDLSKLILKNSFYKQNPSFIALGFWLRKSNLKKILEDHYPFIQNQDFFVRPIGKVFHLCPSNVDTMFIYSLVVSFLGGNKNIIRISSRLENLTINQLFQDFNTIIEKDEFSKCKEFINVISFDRNDELNEQISLKVDARVIWGGDDTVQQFKNYKTSPKIKDLFFTGKSSLSIIWIKEKLEFDQNIDNIVKQLYNDIYTFNQKGCSSPHALLLLAENNVDKQSVIEELYNKLSKLASVSYEEDIFSIASLKLNQSSVDIMEDKVDNVLNTSNYLIFSKIISNKIPESCGTGYVYYDFIEEFIEIKKYITPKTQTISQWGFSDDDIKSLYTQINVSCVDRIVPLGKALDFSYIWDGYNIFFELLSFKKK